MKTRLLCYFLILLFPMLSLAETAKKTSRKKYETVILLHGLARDAKSMWFYKRKLEKARYEVHTVEYKSINRTLKEITDEATWKIDSLLNDERSKIHFVGYSLGGLQVRAYLDTHKIDNLGNVVLIGTPNNGTPFVDKYKDSWWLEMLGETTLSLGTDSLSFPKSLPKPYYPIGIIAGNTQFIRNENIIPGPDDGIVPVESTKIDGMIDFIVINTTHSIMRMNKGVAKQAITFLKEQHFDHKRK